MNKNGGSGRLAVRISQVEAFANPAMDQEKQQEVLQCI
jgi:hypothetical protein